MKSFCTLSDKNYLYNGLCLYYSLKKTSKEDFVLYYLCLDDYTWDILSDINKEDLIPIKLEDLENNDEELMEAKNNKASLPNRSQYEQYCWALAPYFSWYCLHNLEVDSITYVDSDLYFYQDYNLVYEEIRDRSIGIISHRISPPPQNPGEFNVGLVYFKNDEHGRDCVTWWKEVLLDENNKWYETHGTCGDQKYLELFIPLFGEENVQIIDKEVGHGAPWNFNYYEFDEEHIVYKGNKQLMVFNHFSHFNPDFEKNQYRTSHKGEWGPEFTQKRVIQYYQEYFSAAKQANEIIKNIEEKITA